MSKDKKKEFQANQFQVDPRQSLFLSYFLDPKSETFSNCLQSGLRAGYSQGYSESLMAQLPQWLSDSLGELNFLRKAEKNLEKGLDVQYFDEKGKVDSANFRNVMDVSKFVAERLGKKKWSVRNELAGADGKSIPITVNVLNLTDKQKQKFAMTGELPEELYDKGTVSTEGE